MDYRHGLAVALSCVVSLLPVTAQAGFSEGSHLTLLPLNTYAARGLTFHTGDLTSALAGVTTPGSASSGPYIFVGGSRFPTPSGGGGIQTDPYAYHAGIATFDAGTRRVGLTASQNGTTYLTVWDTSGTLLGQVTWAPSGDAAFVGVEAGVDIGMVTFGNTDLWAGGTYTIGGGTIVRDTWVWAPGAVCGDGVPDGVEDCDDGASNSDSAADACRSTCMAAGCGDGVVDTDEQCDGASG